MQVEAIRDDWTVLDNTIVNANGNFYQRDVQWHQPLVGKQFTFLITMLADDCTRIGNLYIQYQQLGYHIMRPPA